MKSLISKALQIIDNKLIKASETNAMYTLSDGSKVNKKELNKRIMVLREFIEHAVNMDEEIMALMSIVKAKQAKRAVKLIEQQRILDRDLLDMETYETPCARYVPEKENITAPEPVKPEVRVIDAKRLGFPSGSNKRFICGFIYGEVESFCPEFVMVFWNNYDTPGNSHGDLEQYYKENHNSRFEAVSGGFFINSTHNNSVGFGNPEPANVYLFGKSSTFRSFGLEQPYIEEYGKKINVNFIFGKTQFEMGEYNDIIGENFLK